MKIAFSDSATAGGIVFYKYTLNFMNVSNKRLVTGQGYVKERWQSFLRKFYGRYGMLSNNTKSSSSAYYVTLWSMAICNDTLHWSDITLTELNLFTKSQEVSIEQL